MSRTDNKSEKRKDTIEWILCFAVALVLAILIRVFVFELVVVRQSSMTPNLISGNKVGVSKLSYMNDSPQRGDIVIIKIDDSQNFIKRVIALSGETIEIKDSVVYINGNAISEEYIGPDVTYNDYGPVRVEQGCIFVMGDNRPYSRDSRDSTIGQIPYERIVGKAIFRLSPFLFYGF